MLVTRLKVRDAESDKVLLDLECGGGCVRVLAASPAFVVAMNDCVAHGLEEWVRLDDDAAVQRVTRIEDPSFPSRVAEPLVRLRMHVEVDTNLFGET